MVEDKRERDGKRMRLEDLRRFQEDSKIIGQIEVDICLPPYIPGLH
jgi:hypothetical protein